MGSRVDYDALRAQAMNSGSDEAVTVNTRALIDKVLARYPGEWTTLRELIQNAADASASKVIIKIETTPSATIPAPQSDEASSRLKHVLSHHTVNKWVVENDGEKFRPQDWARLKKIAEGNPDETKIGAFGVGFYSVFDTSEEPLVSSGSEALAFYWRGDTLFTRRVQLNSDEANNTTFVLPMRDTTSHVPHLMSLCQFLTSSLTFVGLTTVELWIDEWKVFDVRKVAAPSSDVEIPRGINKTSETGLMRISSLIRESIQMEAHWIRAVEWKPTRRIDTVGLNSEPPGKGLRSFFSKFTTGSVNQAAEKAILEERARQNELADDLLGESRATTFLHVIKASVKTLADRRFSAELERATKKPPPKVTTVSLLTASYNEHEASDVGKNTTAAALFESVVPSTGRIFIGFPTKQTTGFGAHISTPSVIPTVERESIDLNSPSIKRWNSDLLRVAGVVARITWISQMREIHLKLSIDIRDPKRSNIPQNILATALPQAQFLHQNFTWKASTPLSAVTKFIEDSFWTCTKDPIEVLSSRGVIPVTEVRIAKEDLTFIEDLPIIPDLLVKTKLVEFLIEVGMITEVSVSDIIGVLEQKTLDAEQLQRLLGWMARMARAGTLDKHSMQSIINVAVANDEVNGCSKVIVLSQIKTFLNPDRISPDMPLPPTTMPFKFTKTLSKFDTESFGWDALQVIPWLRWVVENAGGRRELPIEEDITSHSSFASAVMRVLSKQWDGLSGSSKTTAVQLLANQTVMPTKTGMKKPTETYFPSVKLFDDLPVLVSIPNVKEKFLAALGVRKTIEISIVFERLMAPMSYEEKAEAGPKWSHVDLIKYLASVWNDVPEVDKQRIRDTPICPAENTSQPYRISELYEPKEALRRLGLPVVQWPGAYNSVNKEGKLLRSLGLQEAPHHSKIIEIVHSASKGNNGTLRDFALRYFIENYQANKYDVASVEKITTPYLPLQNDDTKLAVPNECFTNEKATILGFKLLRQDLHHHADKFRVQSDPSVDECIARLLKSPPRTKRAARDMFGYLASRIALITNQHVQTLSQANIVPVPDRSSASEISQSEGPTALEKSSARTERTRQIRHLPPRICFLGDGGEYAEVFDFVDFGPEANLFLLRCGSKNEPTTPEIAYILTQQPAKFFGVLGMSKYLETLVRISRAWKTIKNDKKLVEGMRRASFLLASKEIPHRHSALDGKYDEKEEGQSVKTWQLAPAGHIVIVDDVINYQIFKHNLLAAPQEEALEELYLRLGASDLGSLVEEQHTIGKLRTDQTNALKLQDLIKERSRLYLHDYLSDAIKRDAQWVQQNLTVQAVQSIALRKTLTVRGLDTVHSESKTATLHQSRSQGWVLYVTDNYDMWQVSQVLVHLLLNRPKPREAIVLQMILRSDLLNLRSMGYNVERILRQKEEARIAHEMRQRQLEQEERAMRMREAASPPHEPETDDQGLMPGMFPTSAGSREQPRTEPRGPGGIFADLGKRFGLELGAKTQAGTSGTQISNAQHTAMEDEEPPPYSLSNTPKVPRLPSPKPPGGSMSPHELSSLLTRAIKSSRPHGSSSLISEPEVHQVQETHSYCDAKPGTDIYQIGTAKGIRVFLDKEVQRASQIATRDFMVSNEPDLQHFASVLLDCAAIYELPKGAMHIFYDETGPAIAFNRAQSLFFNFRFFRNDHLAALNQGNRTTAITFWAVVFAHELAHNLEADHNSNFHSYSEGLIVEHLLRIAATAKERTGRGLI
ncbi:MAG: hypothetical protein Q9190_003405 [Brigantiaea leucoxantha]